MLLLQPINNHNMNKSPVELSFQITKQENEKQRQKKCNNCIKYAAPLGLLVRLC